jgi:hypothetical protein
MSRISIPLPDEDLAFLRVFAKAQGDSAEGFLARHARNLRLHLQTALHPDVQAASGAFSTSGEPLSKFYDEMALKRQ